jgi:hypothetical protein
MRKLNSKKINSLKANKINILVDLVPWYTMVLHPLNYEINM